MNHLNNLNGWIALMHVADTGSMSTAASAMQVEVSTVSRLIASLEKSLGRELIQRKSRPTKVTENGLLALDQVRPILQMHQAFVTTLLDDSREMAGTIRLSVAPGTLPRLLMPMLIDFQKLYPKVEFSISSGRQINECLSGKIDVASVNGPVTEKGLVILDRGHPVYIAVASPSYLEKHGFPARPEDLSEHVGFVYKGPVRPSTTSLEKSGESRPIRWKSSMQSSDILMIKAAVMNGLGVAVDIPFAHCHEELKRGELVPILNGWHRPSLGASVVCSQAAWHIRRVRVFMQWYSERYREEFSELEKRAPELLGEHYRHYFQ